MRIAIVTDAWKPQVNGVVRALSSTIAVLQSRGHEVELISPVSFRTIACPTYPEIRLALRCAKGVAARLDAFEPDAIHLATEGPLGWAARRWCLEFGMPFTTSFHTRFPDYVALRTGLPASLFWHPLRRFHAPAERVMAATAALSGELRGRRVGSVHRWPLGVDLDLFHPGRHRCGARQGEAAWAEAARWRQSQRGAEAGRRKRVPSRGGSAARDRAVDRLSRDETARDRSTSATELISNTKG